MNPLNSIKMHLKGVERGMAGIKTEETRSKAVTAIREMVSRVVPVEPIAVSESGVILSQSVVSETEGGVSVTLVAEMPVESKETAPVAIYNGNPVLTPISDHECEGVGGPSVVITEEVKVELPPVESKPVEVIGGWPERGEVEILGLAANRRHLRGKLPDGRIVAVERTFGRNWKNGDVAVCRLIRAGAASLYRVTP